MDGLLTRGKRGMHGRAAAQAAVRVVLCKEANEHAALQYALRAYGLAPAAGLEEEQGAAAAE